MAGAGYYRGFLLECNTNNTAMGFVIRDADTNNSHAFTGPAGNNNINHARQQQIEYTFTTPFVAHLCRYEPGNDANNNAVQWQFFGIKWLVDPWPEVSTEVSAWLDLGTSGAKYVTSVTIPMDTLGNNANINFLTSDNSVNLAGPFNTPANQKTPVATYFPVPFIFHEVQIQPQNNVRLWTNEALWNFEPWPELIPESSMWFDGGSPRAKYTRGGVLPIDTNGNNVSFAVFYDGNNNFAVGPFNTLAGAKTPVAFAASLPSPFVPFCAHEFRVQPLSPCRVWWKEAAWDQEVWPELLTGWTPWFNCGTPGVKYMRGFVLPIETGGTAATFELVSSDGSTVTFGPYTTSNLVKTPTPVALSIPQIGHEYQIRVLSGTARIWLEEARWDFDPWPELITEATGWMNVMPGGAAGFLQGLLLPVEAAGAGISLSLLTDTSTTPIPLIPIRTPLANVKTPIPYSLATPVVCHQVQIVPTAACRVWLNEISWIAEATPELAVTWATQATSHGCVGFHSVQRIEAVYSSTASVTLTLTAFDGTSPQAITLPGTGGAKQKTLLTLTYNKGQLYTYSAVSSSAFQMFEKEWNCWIAQWGRKGAARRYNLLGGAFDDKAAI